MKQALQAVLMLLSVSCAGDLSDPGRFAFLYDSDGGIRTGGSGGASGGTAGGSGSTAGRSGSGAGTSGSSAGMGGSMGTPPSPAPACVTALFKMKCGSVGCHASGGTQVDLVSANVEQRLVGKPSASQLPCKGKTLVSPGGDSLLIDKINDPPPCGSLMPITGSLTDSDRSCLTDWVSSLSN